jgi:capsular polysaccharide biosynthesis protein
MSELNNMNTYLFDLVRKNIKLFLIIGVLAAIASVIFSSPTFIAPKYKSTAIVYPSNLGEYSDESPIEQMVQWFESRSIKNSVIAELDLASHYDIDTEAKLGSYYVLLEYGSNVSVNETKYESAEIVVTDTDPEMAFKIASANIRYFNELVRAEHKKRAKEDLITAKNQLEKIQYELDSVSSELKKIRTEYNIISYGAQSEEVTKGYLGTFDGANRTSINKEEIKILKKNIEEKGGDFVMLDQRVYHLLDAYKYWEEEYNKVLMVYNREMTYTNMVTAPSVSYKKVYPIRWLIVISSTLMAVFFAFVVLLFLNKFKRD